MNRCSFAIDKKNGNDMYDILYIYKGESSIFCLLCSPNVLPAHRCLVLFLFNFLRLKLFDM